MVFKSAPQFRMSNFEVFDFIIGHWAFGVRY